VLTLVWAVYCLVGYPWQQRVQAAERSAKDRQLCYSPPLGKDYASPDDIGECLKLAEQGWRTIRVGYLGHLCTPEGD
jgi:hypothetical protein